MSESETVTVAQLDDLAKQIADQREKCDNAEAAATVENKILASLESKMVEHLKALERENYASPYGTLTIRKDWRVNLPDGPENWDKLFSHFKEKGIFEGMITVNSNKLNSYYKEEQKIAEEEGRAMEFEVPGLEAPKLRESLTYRKGSKK